MPRRFLWLYLVAARVDVDFVERVGSGTRRWRHTLRIGWHARSRALVFGSRFTIANKSARTSFECEAVRREDAARDLFGRACARIDVDARDRGRSATS